MVNTKHLLSVLAFAISGINAYKLHYYQSQRCTGLKLDQDVFGPERGCQSLGGAKANTGSLIVESTGPIDDPFMVVLFESNDCNPDTIVGHGDENSGCIKPDEGKAFSSYQVWDLWE